MAFIDLLRGVHSADRSDSAADRVAREARFRRYNRNWYDLLTAMPIHRTRTGTCWVAAREVHEILGIPEQERPSEARRVAHALAALGWRPANVGPAYRRVRGYVRIMDVEAETRRPVV